MCTQIKCFRKLCIQTPGKSGFLSILSWKCVNASLFQYNVRYGKLFPILCEICQAFSNMVRDKLSHEILILTEEIVSLMTLSSGLRPLLQKVMAVYTVYMKGVKQGEMFELQLHFFLSIIFQRRLWVSWPYQQNCAHSFRKWWLSKLYTWRGLNRVRRWVTVTLFSLHYISEEIVSLMTLSSELRPLLQKVMVVYTVYMKGVKQGEIFELQSQKATLLLTTLYNTLMSCDTLFDIEESSEGGEDQRSAELVRQLFVNWIWTSSPLPPTPQLQKNSVIAYKSIILCAYYIHR